MSAEYCLIHGLTKYFDRRSGLTLCALCEYVGPLHCDQPMSRGSKHLHCMACGVELKPPTLRTENTYPPIPNRNFDWTVIDDDTYDGAPDAGPQLMGSGPTETLAIEDFWEQWNEKQAA